MHQVWTTKPMQRNTGTFYDMKTRFSVVTCRPYSFTLLFLYCLRVSKHGNNLWHLVTETKTGKSKLVDMFRWVKESTLIPLVSHPMLPEHCRVAGRGEWEKETITESLRTYIYRLVWWHQILIQGELWILQDSRKDIAGAQLDPAALEEQYLPRVQRCHKRHPLASPLSP